MVRADTSIKSLISDPGEEEWTLQLYANHVIFQSRDEHSDSETDSIDEVDGRLNYFPHLIDQLNAFALENIIITSKENSDYHYWSNFSGAHLTGFKISPNHYKWIIQLN